MPPGRLAPALKPGLNPPGLPPFAGGRPPGLPKPPVRGLAAPPERGPGRGLSNPPGRRGLPELVVVEVRPFPTPAGRGLPELAPAGRGLPKDLPGPAGLRKLLGLRAAGAASEADAGRSPAAKAGRGARGDRTWRDRTWRDQTGGDRRGACPFLFRRLRTSGSRAWLKPGLLKELGRPPGLLNPPGRGPPARKGRAPRSPLSGRERTPSGRGRGVNVRSGRSVLLDAGLLDAGPPAAAAGLGAGLGGRVPAGEYGRLKGRSPWGRDGPSRRGGRLSKRRGPAAGRSPNGLRKGRSGSGRAIWTEKLRPSPVPVAPARKGRDGRSPARAGGRPGRF